MIDDRFEPLDLAAEHPLAERGQRAVGLLAGLHVMADQQIAELQSAGTHIVKGNRGYQLWLQRIIQINDHQPFGRGDVGVVATENHMPGTVKHAALIPGHCPC